VKQLSLKAVISYVGNREPPREYWRVSGAFQIPFHLASDAAEIHCIPRRYRDREADLAGACSIHLANELRTGEILTLDRDFEIYRWGTNKRFQPLIPFA
jgi:hypothetical protein